MKTILEIEKYEIRMMTIHDVEIEKFDLNGRKMTRGGGEEEVSCLSFFLFISFFFFFYPPFLFISTIFSSFSNE